MIQLNPSLLQSPLQAQNHLGNWSAEEVTVSPTRAPTILLLYSTGTTWNIQLLRTDPIYQAVLMKCQNEDRIIKKHSSTGIYFLFDTSSQVAPLTRKNL